MRPIRPVLAIFCLLAAPPARARADQTPPPSAQDDQTPRFRLPEITVTAQKEPVDKQKAPVSVTAVPEDTIRDAGIRIISDAALFAPNVFYTEFTARKLSNARFRGISSSPNNPGITTFIDGVPQISSNSANIDLLDVEQIEFVRGPQSALFGRNTLGGLVNVTSRRPSRAGWTGEASVPFGNFGSWSARGAVSGPVGDTVSVGLAFAQVKRDGYTVNDVTGNTLDDRSAFSAKGQLLFTPSAAWEARLIVSGERARDGDYALHDLAQLRANPFHASRDFEGAVDRDIVSTTIQARRQGASVVLSSTTGFVKWQTQDVTDLDYSARPLVVRDNSEEDFLFTQEVRLASPAGAARKVSDSTSLAWQTGVFLFTQAYEQDAVNTFAPFVLSQSLNFPVSQHSPQSELDDFGLGLFGQATVTFDDRLDLIGGARFDYEAKDAQLATFYEPAIAAPTMVAADETFSNVSPQVSVAYRIRPQHTIYGTVAGGFKAGGFNPAAPAGAEAYDEEQTWNVEGGVKTSWANGRVTANAAVFFIDWSDLQLNVPNPQVPAQFYISNVGSAASRGVEIDINARPAEGLDVFGAFGYTHARFGDDSRSGGVPVGGNRVPGAPEYTASAGLQYSHALSPAASVYARLDAVFYGAYRYDDLNRQGQDAYGLGHLRGGYRGRYFFAEAWVRNITNTFYVPVAFAYGSLAPSGFVGEAGAPRTFGLNAGVKF